MTLEPQRALRAVVAISRDPDDTAQVFALIEALSGVRTPRRIARRLAGDPLLRERPDVTAHLCDHAALRRLPTGSLGHAYLRFMQSEGISAAGLRDASARGERGEHPIAADVAYVRARMRDTHDLWHVVLGYGGDVLGEAAVLAFTFAQTGDPAMGALMLVGLGKLRTRDAQRLIAGAFVRGVRAAWFPAQRWEALLALPLDAVRERLGVGRPPAYAAMRSADLRAAGLLG